MNRRSQIIKADCVMGILQLSACSPSQDSKRVMDRAVSPDGKREAVHVEDVSGGATVYPSEEVFVVDRGSPLQWSKRIASLEKICRLGVKWLGNDMVEISYFARRASENRSLWKSASIEARYRWLGRDSANGC
jgi:hypothetical protein